MTPEKSQKMVPYFSEEVYKYHKITARADPEFGTGAPV